MVANHVATPHSTGLAHGFIRYSDTKYAPLEMALNTTIAQTRAVVDAWQAWRRGGGGLPDVSALVGGSLRPKGNYNWHDPRSAREITAEFLSWQESLGPRPIFGFLNLFDAHEPREPPPPYRTMFDTTPDSHGRYLGAIRYMDGAMEDLLRELERRGALERTLVIIASDYGEAFGEHGQYGHGNGLFLPLLRVPLLVLNAPRARTGSRVRQSVSLVDLAATILDLTATPNDLGIGGVSLRPLLEGTHSAFSPRPVVAELNRGFNLGRFNPLSFTDYKTVIDDTLHVIRSNAGAVQVFAHRTDPSEQSSLATDPIESRKAESWMRQVLTRNDIRWRAHVPPPDLEARRRLRDDRKSTRPARRP